MQTALSMFDLGWTVNPTVYLTVLSDTQAPVSQNNHGSIINARHRALFSYEQGQCGTVMQCSMK